MKMIAGIRHSTRNFQRHILAVVLLFAPLVSNLPRAISQQIYSEINSAQEFISSNLPVLVIDTFGKNIQNNTRVTVHLGVIDNSVGRNALTDPFNNYDGLINIEIRGSSGQWQNWPKKQYGFETCDSSGNNLNVALLGLPAENDWILYPPYSDKSMIRNILAYRFARDMGRYASRTRLCELVVNGDYRGVYVLLEKIKRDKRRVDIAELQPDDNNGDQLTGGYIIKVDREAGEENDGWVSPYSLKPDRLNMKYLFHYPKPGDISPAQQEYIINYITAFETLMNQNDWQLYYREYLDIDSFIDFWIISEFTKNVDSFSLSTFLYKDKNSKDKRLVMGPVWDFNLGFGNVNYYEGELTSGFILDRKVQLVDKIPAWCKNLDQDPEIRKMFAERWHDLRGSVLAPARINSLIDSLTTVLDEAQARNFNRWPILGQYVWPNNYVGHSYAEEINYLKNWIRQRCDWLDQETEIYTEIAQTPPNHYHLVTIYPNPFNESAIIDYHLLKSSRVQISVYDVLGRLVSTLLDEEKAAGDYQVNFTATDLAGGIYFVRVTGGGQYSIARMTCVK
ncbi:MAG TPA: CotH kinase family protein [bacterium]|nr:CotH kinase family protein [bacterium]HPN43411.1 CotH kinase family protein [bacterium]